MSSDQSITFEIDKIIQLESNCNSEIRDPNCYNFASDELREKIECVPLLNILSVTKDELSESLKKIMSENGKYNFINQGTFNTTFKLNIKSKIFALRLTRNMKCPDNRMNINNELNGLYYQTKFSKPKHRNGIGCKNICEVYDFGKYKILNENYLPTVPAEKKKFRSTEGIYAFLEYLPGGELFDKIIKERWHSLNLPTKIKRTKKIICQLLEGLKCIHEGGYVHLDLKLENILCVSKDFEDDSVKLIDFGFMKKIGEPKRGIFGSPNYIPRDFYDYSVKEYSEKFDIWSIGIIFFTCIFGFYPTGIPKNSHGGPLTLDETIVEPSEKDYTRLSKKYPNDLQHIEELKEIFDKIFTNSSERPTAEGLLDILDDGEKEHKLTVSSRKGGVKSKLNRRRRKQANKRSKKKNKSRR